MEQVTVSGRNGQPPRDDHCATNFLNRLNLPTPTRSTVVEVFGDGVPGAEGQRDVALFPGLEVARVNRSGEIRQSFSSGAQVELGGSCLRSITGGLEHWIDSLWSSLLKL